MDCQFKAYYIIILRDWKVKVSATGLKEFCTENFKEEFGTKKRSGGGRQLNAHAKELKSLSDKLSGVFDEC